MVILKQFLCVVIFALGVSLVLNSAHAGVFRCTCGNGTPCTVTCGCTGGASCGPTSCSSHCAACAQNGLGMVAISLGTAIYQTSYIVRRRDYSPSNLIGDVSGLMKQADARKIDGGPQLGTDGRLYVVLTHKSGPLEQSILFPQDFLGLTGDFIKIVTENAPQIGATVQERLKNLEGALWPR